jgi:hypothetical protein
VRSELPRHQTFQCYVPVVVLGALPALVSVFWRPRMHEAPHFGPVAKEALKGGWMRGVNSQETKHVTDKCGAGYGIVGRCASQVRDALLHVDSAVAAFGRRHIRSHAQLSGMADKLRSPADMPVRRLLVSSWPSLTPVSVPHVVLFAWCT